MRLSLAMILCAPLAVAACTDPFASLGQKPAPEPVAVEAPKPEPIRPPAVSPLEQPIEVAVLETSATVDGATNPVAAFKARGNEPFWSVHVGNGSAVYSTPDLSARSVPVRRIAFAKGVEYIGVMNDKPFALRVTGAACTDSMSGEKFEFTARLSANGRSVNGCASATTENPPKAPAAKGASAPKTPAKPKAPAKPKKPAPATPATPAPATPAPVTTTPVTPAPVAPATPAPVVTTPPVTTAPVVVVPPSPLTLPPAAGTPSMN